MSAKDRTVDKDLLRITNQSRVRDGMEYWLKWQGVHLKILMTPRGSESQPDAWRVEARAGGSREEAYVACESAATRIDALRAVGKAWTSDVATHGLATFDWDAVAKALAEVKAL